MKKFAILGLAAVVAGAGIGLTACTEPIQATQDTWAQPQLLVSDYWLRAQIRMTAPTVERVGAGQLKVTAQIRNIYDEPLSIDYRTWFVDERGAPVDNQTGWQYANVPQNGYENIEATSLSAAAKDFRIEVRKAK